MKLSFASIFSLFFLIKIGYSDKQAKASSDSRNIPVDDESAALASQFAAIKVPHVSDNANIPKENSGRDSTNGRGNNEDTFKRPIYDHTTGNNGVCPDLPEDCGACRGWDPASQCGSNRPCGKGYSCCETFCCFRQCTIPQDEYKNAYYYG
jgi:hypothetical protein